MNYSYDKICELFNINISEPLEEEQISEIKNHFGAIPKALEDYYRLCGGCRDMNSTQDFLLVPDGRYVYKNFKNYNYDGYCVFYVENQCVLLWAIKKSDLDKENPPVYETSDNGQTWYKITDTVSQFLISHAYLQAAFSFEYSSEEFYDANKEQTEQIAEKFPHVDADSLLYTGVKFFQPYTDTVITVMNDGDDFFVIYSSQNEQHFNEIEDIIYKILDL